MLQCPNCHTEVKPEERFCGTCGARLPEQPVAPPPARPTTGRETVILPSVPSDIAPASTPDQPEKTIIAGPAPIPPSQFPPTPATPPASQLPPTTPLPPPGASYPGASYPGADLPPGSAASPPKSGGSNIWKILGIIAGIGVLACVALAIGAYILFNRAASQVGNVFSTASAGLSTVEAMPTFAPFPTFEADATPESEQVTPEEAAPTFEPEATAEAGNGTTLGGAVLLRDSFDSASTSNFTEGETDNAIYSFVDGTYSVKVKQPKLILWKTMRGDYSNAAISVEATIDGPTESAAGLIFHYQDDKNFYIFTAAADGSYSLDLYKNDELTHLIDWTKSSALKGPGELNVLSVETQGDSIRLFANDELLDEISDSTFSRGKAALVVNTFADPNVIVTFDNLTVKAIK